MSGEIGPWDDLVTSIRLMQARLTLEARGLLVLDFQPDPTQDSLWHVKRHIEALGEELGGILADFDAALPQEDPT